MKTIRNAALAWKLVFKRMPEPIHLPIVYVAVSTRFLLSVSG